MLKLQSLSRKILKTSAIMVLLADQKVKIVQFWHETKSYITVRRKFCKEFDVHMRNAPNDTTIKRIVEHFEAKGTVHNTHKGNSGRPSVVKKGQANIDAVCNSTTKNVSSPSLTGTGYFSV